MKTIVGLMILLTLNLTGKSQEDSIFAVVSNDTVTLWHISAYRNCSASYQMVVAVSDYKLTWLESDTGDMVHCDCYFDLSVTAGPLLPGAYSVDVYHTERWEMDTLYDGSTSFVIEQSTGSGAAEVIGSWISDCYDLVGTAEDPVIPSIRQNFPNPFSDRTTITCTPGDHSAMYLQILNMLGEVVRVLELEPDATQITWDGTDDRGKSLPSGIYYYGSSSSREGFRKMVIIR
ncbi:MAG TPA: FlgD immunoglobulin-like domain containing protein [Bacteroidales bacterium]|nr:FlgD immunoglobulin-like domain containing protein [Bacteroidales bacterium]